MRNSEELNKWGITIFTNFAYLYSFHDRILVLNFVLCPFRLIKPIYSRYESSKDESRNKKEESKKEELVDQIMKELEQEYENSEDMEEKDDLFSLSCC